MLRGNWLKIKETIQLTLTYEIADVVKSSARYGYSLVSRSYYAIIAQIFNTLAQGAVNPYKNANLRTFQSC